MLEEYHFLELISLQAAVSRGANMDDRIVHAVYQTIQRSSTSQHLKNNALFTINSIISDTIVISRPDLKRTLFRLIADKLVVQIFRIEYEPSIKGLSIIPYYIAFSPDDKDVSYELFTRIQLQSMQALESYLDSLPGLEANAFREELELDLKSEKMLAADKLPNSIVNFFAVVHASNFDIIPPSGLLDTAMKDLRETLFKKVRIVEIPDYGFMPIRESEVLLRFETAVDFMKRKIIPRYKSRGNAKKELEQIAMEEARLALEPHAQNTAEFEAARANVLRKNITAGPIQEGGIRFPGQLALDTIICLEIQATARYREKRKLEYKNLAEDFKRELLDDSAHWRRIMRFVGEKEMEEYPPDVARTLMSDSELLYGTWNRTQDIAHIFVRNDPRIFRLLFERLAEEPPGEIWKIPALRSILEKVEHDAAYRALFDDPEFIVIYGNALRRAYIDEIPWYYKIFLLVGIYWFQNHSFRIAKGKILNHQHHMADRHQMRREEEARTKEQEILERKDRIRDLIQLNLLVEVLNGIYLIQGRVALLGEVKTLLADEMDGETLATVIARENFRILPATGKSGPDESAILYPMDHEWRVRAVRLKKSLGERLDAIGKGADEEEKKEVALVKRVLRYIDRGEENTKERKKKKESEDPYEQFAHVLDIKKEEETQNKKEEHPKEDSE